MATIGREAARAPLTSADINDGIVTDADLAPTLDLSSKTLTLGAVSSTGNLTFGDNDKAIFGAGSDLQIYHDGSNSYISDQGSGTLKIQGDSQVRLESTAGERYFVGNNNGAARLYYDDSEKLATTATGIDVTGTVTADGLTVQTGAGTLTTAAFGGSSVEVASSGAYKHSSDLAAGYHLFEVNSLRVALFNNGGDIYFYEDTGTTPKFFWDASAESLGIGTTSPSQALHVVGNTLIPIASSYHCYTTDYGIGTPDSFGLQIFTGSSDSIRFGHRVSGTFTEDARVDISGNFSIGTTGTDYASAGRRVLRVEGSTNALISASDGTSFAYFHQKGGTNGVDIWNTANSYMRFGTNDGEAMRITSAGNVGIGTDSPASLVSGGSSPVLSIGGTDGGLITGEKAGALSFITSDASYTTTYPNGVTGEIVSVAESATGAAYGLAFYTGTITSSNRGERVRISNSGDVGIGTSSPSELLHIEETTNSTDVKIRLRAFNSSSEGRSAYVTYSPDSRIMGFGEGGDELNIDSSGNVTIGSTDAGNAGTLNLSVGLAGTTTGGIQLWSPTNGTHYVQFGDSAAGGNPYRGAVGYTHTSDAMLFFTAGTESARIDSSGNLLVGTTASPDGTTGGAGFISGSNSRRQLHLATTSTAGNGLVNFFNPNGNVGSIETSGSATAYNTSSDARLKENIADAEDAGAKVDAIQVRQFDWKADGSHQDYGMVAQELLTVAPEAVSGDPESDDMMGVDYSKLVPMLVKEIQSLRARVHALEGK